MREGGEGGGRIFTMDVVKINKELTQLSGSASLSYTDSTCTHVVARAALCLVSFRDDLGTGLVRAGRGSWVWQSGS